MNLFSMKEKIVVVTGGLGRLGRQYTAALADAGARVAVFDTVAGRAPEPAVPGILVLDVDVTDRGSIERGLEAVRRRWGIPHGLVNNAALDSPPDAPAAENGPFETYPAESWQRVMDVNAKGVFHCCQVIGGAMAEEGRGSIVNIGSIYGLVSPDQRIYDYRRAKGAPFFKPAAYGVSKSALLNLTRYLATYWAARNVRVNTLTLGGVFDGQDDSFLREYKNRVPLGRMARKDEYNGAVVFLLSEASSYMTGSNLLIDGGWTAW
jgi:NAD(P)-dependent dehydrogenase (short-subunit alcohol dehydrogenase family)